MINHSKTTANRLAPRLAPATQASQRTLSADELHQQLRLADSIIDFAFASMSIDAQMKLVRQLSISDITQPFDPLAKQSRQQALNRTKPCYRSPLQLLARLLGVRHD